MMPPKQFLVMVEPILSPITPFAMAKFSHHIFKMANHYGEEGDGSRVPKLYMFCVSTELGLKAAILSPNCNEERKVLIKKLGHNLEKIIHIAKAECGVDLFSDKERAAVSRINPFYRDKALEYFTSSMLEAMLTGYQDLPEVEMMEAVATKVQAHVAAHEFFINPPPPVN